ncbi:MAG TPA: DUF885 family protein, partial [Micromonosporaceae bacterium]|nr:DUF885 family protein [Micromonosporaceae bacterium]
MTVVTGLADELLDAVNARDPLLATLDGFRDRDHLLGDFSEAGEAAASSRLDGIVRRARAIDPASLPAADRLTRTVILAYGRAQLDRLAARGVEYTITPLYVAPAAELLFGLPMVGIVTSEHADGYLSRLRRVPGLLVT